MPEYRIDRLTYVVVSSILGYLRDISSAGLLSLSEVSLARSH